MTQLCQGPTAAAVICVQKLKIDLCETEVMLLWHFQEKFHYAG